MHSRSNPSRRASPPVRRAAPLALALLGASALVAPAFAQQAPAAAGSAVAVGEVVVTAEKRSSTVQKTPISISVVTGQELQAQGITDIATVAQQVPGISFKTAGPGQTEFEMRGLTSTGGESPTVGFYLDETPLTPPAMAQNGKVVVDPDLYDLARVEVLRGPQGTLYGAGSMGGTIKLVTNQPDLNAYGASAELVGSGTDGGGFNHTENLMVNIPLDPGKLALRVVGTDKYVDGWISREVLDPFPLESDGGMSRGDVAAAPVAQDFKNSNWERLQGGRASLEAQPTDRLTVITGVLFQQIKQGAPNTIDSPPGQDVHYQPYNVAEPFHDSYVLGDFTVKYDFDFAQLTSATSYWNRDQFQTQDITEAMQDFFGSAFGSYQPVPVGAFGPPGSGAPPYIAITGDPDDFPYSFYGPATISEKDGTDQVSEELRLSSSGSGRLQWLVGGFYSAFNATSHVYSYYPSTGGFVDQWGTNNLADNHRFIKVDQTAFFGEASYKITDQLKATAGFRYFSYDSNSVTSVSGVSANGTSAPLYATAKNSGVTPKFNLSYTPTDDLDIYATASEGFRPGGPNSPIPYDQCGAAPTQFGPDSVWSYELGEKARAFDRRLTINGDVYYETWNGVQQAVTPACGFTYTTNAGKAEVYGAELEITFKITPDLTFTQNAGYTHATNSTTEPLAGVTAGQRLLDVPDWTANTSLIYRHELTNDIDFVGRANNSYVGSMQDITYVRNDLPGYDLVDLRAGVEAKAWSAYLFIDNATNKTALLTDTAALSANVPVFNRVAVNQPRTIGLDLSYKY
jgi:outer membrane receptor protein involved in Fe transport